MKSLVVTQLNDTSSCRSYLVADEDSREAAIVDPLLEGVPAYLALLRARGLQLRWAVDSHTHADHLSGSRELAAATSAQTAGSPRGAVNLLLIEGDRLPLGAAHLEVWSSPGHTADSLVLLGPGFALTGDTLLIGATGRTDLPTGDPEAEWQSVQRLLALPDETVVWPGHEYAARTSSTVGEERRKNPRALMARDEFITTMNAPRAGKPALLEQALAWNSRPLSH